MRYFALDSGEAQTIERLWGKYYAELIQWWGNRIDKVLLWLPVNKGRKLMLG